MDSDRLSAEIRREFPIEYPEPQFEVADIVRLYGDAYRAAYNPSFEQGRALHAIETIAVQRPSSARRKHPASVDPTAQRAHAPVSCSLTTPSATKKNA